MSNRSPIPATLDELTSLRFFAAFYVVMFHALDNPAAEQVTVFLPNLLHKGYLGVDFFFTLSGFILTHVYVDSLRAGRFRPARFLLNRFARLYPLHFFMLAVFVLTYLLGDALGVLGNGVGMNWEQLPYHVLALHAWGFTDSHSWNVPSWSISAELFAYLIFPLLAFPAIRVRPLAGLAGAVALFVVAFFVCWSQGVKLTGIMYNYGIARIFFEFLMGMFVCLVFREHQFGRGTVVVALPLCVALAAGLAGTGALDVFIVPLFSAIIFLAANLALFARPTVLRSRPLIYLGEISYATYMVHFYILLMLEKIATRFLGAPEGVLPTAFLYLGLALIWIASALLYHFVETPMRRIVRDRGMLLLDRRAARNP